MSEEDAFAEEDVKAHFNCSNEDWVDLLVPIRLTAVHMAHNEAALDKVMADMEIDGLLDWWRMVRDRLREVATLMDDALARADIVMKRIGRSPNYLH